MSTARRIAVGFTGDQLASLVEEPGVLGGIDRRGLVFAALGLDRITRGIGAARAVDASVAATVFAAATSETPLLVAAAPQRDHPYNLARRVASVDHLSGGRAGVLWGQEDRLAPRAEAGREAWGGARLTAGAPLGPGTTRDAARVVAELWQTFPVEAIVGDRATGIYARADLIAHADHTGVFDSAGPLNVPTTPQGAPVSAWLVQHIDEWEASVGAVEVVVAPASVANDILSRGESRPVFAILRTNEADLAAQLARLRPAADVLLTADGTISELLVTADRLIATEEVIRVRGGTLRERLGFGAPTPLLANARPAFAAPRPLVAR